MNVGIETKARRQTRSGIADQVAGFDIELCGGAGDGNVCAGPDGDVADADLVLVAKSSTGKAWDLDPLLFNLATSLVSTARRSRSGAQRTSVNVVIVVAPAR